MTTTTPSSATIDGPSGREALRLARGLAGDPLPVLRELHERWGDVSRMRLPGATLAFLFHPDDIEHVVVGHARDVDKGRILKQLRPLMGLHLFTLEGTEHARRRKIASGVFRPRDLPPKVAPVVDAVTAMAARWPADVPIDVLAELDLLVISAVGGGLFGRSIESEAPRIQELVHELYGYLPWATSPQFAITGRLPLPRTRRMLRRRRALTAIVESLAREAQARIEAGDTERGDVATLLLQAHDETVDGASRLSFEQVVDELAGLLVAAHEGVALTVTWALHELAAQPELRARAEAEVDRVLQDGRSVVPADLRELPLLRAIVDETVRTYGSTMLIRGLQVPVELPSGARLERGWQVICGMYEVHRDPRWWREPERFDPSRFGPDAGDRPRFAYFPFGGGRRTCIGSHLGLQTCMVMLAQLLRDFRLERVDDEPIGVYSQVLVRPTRPILMRATARTPAG